MDQRPLARLKVKVRIDLRLYELVSELARASNTSLSECVENMVLLVKGICHHSKAEEPIFAMRELKHAALANAPSLRDTPQKRTCHLTLHPDAVSFAAQLHQTYPPVYSSINEAYELCIRYCCQYYDEKNRSVYLRKRLEDVKKFQARQS